MCGIAGIWNRDGQPAEDQILRQMVEALRHRGPDDTGIWTHRELGLGHTRLSILDLSPRGHQPFVTEDGLGTVTYNGEIYNFQELRPQLQKEGVVFRSQSDTEVLLYALHRWGPERAIPLFDGMFAFAYFDRRTETLWLARDRLGIKPLYVTETGARLFFASEIKALLKHPAVRCLPNLQALTAYLFSSKFQPEVVPFEGIQPVQAGTYWRVLRSSIEITTYFDVLRDLDIDRLVAAQRESIQVDQLESAISTSVRDHLVSDAPLAVLCSGGIDSSLITAFAKKHKPDLIAYVAKVKGVIEEEQRATLVANHLGVRLKTVDVDLGEYLSLWPLAVWHGEHPTVMTNDIPLLSLCRSIQQDGVKVVLSGEGSDELFGGYDWQAITYQRWRALRWHARLLPDRWPFNRLRGLAPRLAPVDVAAFQRRPFWRLKDDQAMNASYLASVDAGHRFHRQSQLFERLSRINPVEDRAFLARCYDDLYGYLQQLLQRNDRMAMAASLETRVPFIENRIIDRALYLPRSAKWSNGIGKRVIKMIAEKHLPRQVVHARKIGFFVPQELWRPAAGLLRQGVVASLFRWPQAHVDFILREAEAAPGVLLSLTGIEIWARLFLYGESPANLKEELLRLNHSANLTPA